MKKLYATLAVLMMLFLVGCGGSTQTSTSKSMTDSLSGTYVGKGGSVLTLFPDNTSEYYYMSDTSLNTGAGEWSYGDGVLTWMLNDTPITATIIEQNSLTFTLEQTSGWNREQFIKVSDSTKSKSAIECQQLLRTALNQPEMDNFDAELNRIYDFGGLTVEIPYYWAVREITDEKTTFNAESSQDDTALLMINHYLLDVPGDAFEQIGTEIWNETISSYDEDSCTVLKEVAKYYINGIPAFQGMIRTIADGYTFNQTPTYFYDESSGTLLLVQLIVTDNTIFKYDSDYAKIINSITATAQQVETSPSSNSNGSGGGRAESSSASTGSNGVTPELKAFLDSYEAYMDQYIAFMQKYENSDDTYSMLYDYLDMMQQYTDFAEKLDQYDTDKMSAVDSAYYLEVTTRVAKKLYAAAIQ